MKRVQQSIKFAIETLSELRDERDKADEIELAINIAIGVMKQFDDRLTPKKVIKETYIHRGLLGDEFNYEATRYRCPKCEAPSHIPVNYCWKCGQRIVWDGVKIND